MTCEATVRDGPTAVGPATAMEAPAAVRDRPTAVTTPTTASMGAAATTPAMGEGRRLHEKPEQRDAQGQQFASGNHGIPQGFLPLILIGREVEPGYFMR